MSSYFTFPSLVAFTSCKIMSTLQIKTVSLSLQIYEVKWNENKNFITITIWQSLASSGQNRSQLFDRYETCFVLIVNSERFDHFVACCFILKMSMDNVQKVGKIYLAVFKYEQSVKWNKTGKENSKFTKPSFLKLL